MRRVEHHNMSMGWPHSRTAVAVEPFCGSRSEFLPLFSQADDSPAEINSHIELGEVLVAQSVQ
jgi:hypothetical protein